MEIITDINRMKDISRKHKSTENTISFVPTMGYLHKGHTSLIDKAKEMSDIVIVSIYVNKLQFGENEDFGTYPRNLDRDKSILEKIGGVNYLFIPEQDEISPENLKTSIYVNDYSNILCGITRPKFFGGIATIVLKLFNIIDPDYAIFGMKDFQQFKVIEKMAEDLHLRTKIVGSKIIREKTGLAMSSRNVYLSDNEKKQAVGIYNMLDLGKNLIFSGETKVDKIKDKMKNLMNNKYSNLKLEYLEIVNYENLKRLEKITDKNVILMAAWIGKTRLIDNMIIKL